MSKVIQARAFVMADTDDNVDVRSPEFRAQLRRDIKAAVAAQQGHTMQGGDTRWKGGTPRLAKHKVAVAHNGISVRIS